MLESERRRMSVMPQPSRVVPPSVNRPVLTSLPTPKARKDGRWWIRKQHNGIPVYGYGDTMDEALSDFQSKWYGMPRPQRRVPSPQSKTYQMNGATAGKPSTVKDLLDRFLADHVKLFLSVRTYETYKEAIDLHLAEEFGSIPINELDGPRIQQWINRLASSNAYTTSIRRWFTPLSAALTWGNTQKYVSGNVARTVVLPKVRAGARASETRARRRPKVMPNDDDFRRFLDANREDPLYALWFAGWTLALRDSELVAMSRDQIETDLVTGEPRRVLVHQKAFKPRADRSAWIVEEPKYEGYRELEAPERTLRVLSGQARRMREIENEHPNWSPRFKGWLFRDPRNGEPYCPTRLPKLFKDACRRAGLVDEHGAVPYTPHSMRHYCLSTLILHGIPTKEVAAWAGHHSTKMVEETYSHLLRRSADRESPGEALGKILDFGAAPDSGAEQDRTESETESQADGQAETAEGERN